ncbi:ribosomal protection-like ABC-F family protein [Priestia endophytica]|uniref:ribosomal protection-like ABC-F family protein n=1 Tax=Priestia endophytica TaxID=135735 RepID=UPI00203F47B9|nr:ABC-F type ribosomal protection protein [Priestia endophytica]MCM3538344.1 ABC-F type ribosomal protection protein [Priestia endophytica]
MKEMLKLQNVSYEVTENKLFDKINGKVHEGEVIGIIGKNGAGKSTLLNLIHQQIQPTKGHIQWLEKNIKVVFVEQEKEAYTSTYDRPLQRKLLTEWRVPLHDFSKLSGGEKLKARLAHGFAEESDLLLLDEPTNHLDEESLNILQNKIAAYKGTILLVSHDRAFLDDVVTKIWSIENEQLIEHQGNYSSYMKMRKERRRAEQREYEKQQKMIERIESQMDELSSWSKKAHAESTKKEGFKEYHRVKAKRTDSQVKSKRKRLEKELDKKKVERVEDEYAVQFSIPSHHKVGKRFLEVKKLTKAFNEKILFQNANFTIQHGEKVAITGENGSGKTTLLKIIMGEESAEGDVWISPSAHIGYLTQEVFDLPLAQTPEQLFYRETFAERGEVQNLMKHLGFMSSQWKEPIEKMSMGERVKCKLMMYILEEKDVLILDEPTNHLDLPSREQLEETLSHYNGTLLIVSHDRYFLEKTTETNLILTKGTIQKQFNKMPEKRDNREELKLKLETERQEVLGRLSFIAPGHKEYEELDQKFKELTKRILEL